MRVYAPRTPVRAGNTCIEISVARFSLWTRTGWEFVAFQSVLAHANFRDCFVRRTVAGQRHPCREGRKKKKGTVERREKERGKEEEEEERRTGLCFVPCNCDTSKGFVLRFHSWVALRGLLSSALFCASFFLIDGRVNRSCSPRKRVSPPVSAPPLPPWRDTRPI